MKIMNPVLRHYFLLVNLLLFVGFIISCNNPPGKDVTNNQSDSLTEEQKHLPENALKGLVIGSVFSVSENDISNFLLAVF
jgi:hypothetical protein